MPLAIADNLPTQRERELGAIISAYSEVTDRLKNAHERLNAEVSKLREELEQKNEALRRQDRLAALGEMAAGLAHEVRNPLGGIALYASLLERELVDRPKACGTANKISQNVRSLDRLVSEILAFAQEGQLDLRQSSLGKMLNTIEDASRPWMQERSAELIIDAAAWELELVCDPIKLGQAVLNLVLNGIQAVSAGGRVWLTARQLDKNSNTRSGFKIDIWDDGPGIPTDKLERIFNPFFTTKATGTGLGLAIVHRIVEAHEGTIEVANRPEGGACFSIWIPVLEETRL